jgi:copper chaperone CopZ
MEEIRYSVPGVSCSHCERAITAEVGTVAGVEAIDVDLDAKTVVVRGHGLVEASVRAAIAEAGYEVA